jgi:hypothetical protein
MFQRIFALVLALALLLSILGGCNGRVESPADRFNRTQAGTITPDGRVKAGSGQNTPDGKIRYETENGGQFEVTPTPEGGYRDPKRIK